MGQVQAKRSGQGFTLIELLIVIIVLGILAAIVVFAVGRTRHDSAVGSCKHDVRSVQTSAEAINIKTGAYPDSPDTMMLGSPGNGNLLKEWPTSDAYGIDWNGSQVEVYESTDPSAAFTGEGFDGCEGLGTTSATTVGSTPPPTGVQHGRGHHY